MCYSLSKSLCFSSWMTSYWLGSNFYLCIHLFCNKKEMFILVVVFSIGFHFPHSMFEIFAYMKFFPLVEYVVHRTACPLSEELLFLFPVISLLSSTSKYVKGAATDVLVLLQKLLVTVLIAPKDKPAIEAGYPSLSTPGSIVFRILQHLWFQVYFLFLSHCWSYFLSLSNGFCNFLANQSIIWFLSCSLRSPFLK